MRLVIPLISALIVVLLSGSFSTLAAQDAAGASSQVSAADADAQADAAATADSDADSGSDAEAIAAADSDSAPQRCVRTRRIRRTEIIDDQTVVFFMRGGDVLVNSLPNRCPQLDREDRFAYTARMGQLCSSDVITVLLQFAGRLETGFTCRLSEFVPSSEEAVEIMMAAAEQRGASSPVRAEPVELPPDEAEAEAEADPAETAAEDAVDAE